TTRPHKEGEVPGVDYIFITVEDFMELEKSGALLESGTYEDNYYGTPKPPAEPAPLLLNVTDQILPGATPSAEGKRKRNKSVSIMEKASIEPPEEEEEERPVVNGNGVVITPESSEHEDRSAGASGETPSQPYPAPVYSQPEELKEQVDDTKPTKPEENEDLDPLPDNWEMAYTEKGEVYFIDHNTKTTSWLDPRLAKKAKPPEECKENELPYGWEKIDDPIYGTYYVDHINRRTQFENPVLEAKRKLQQHNMPHTELGTKPLQAPGFREKPLFTRDASQLKGIFLSTTLKKSNMGFGFTIIGGDEPDEFLQVKSVIPDGPAAQDGKMETVTLFCKQKIFELNSQTTVTGIFKPVVIQKKFIISKKRKMKSPQSGKKSKRYLYFIYACYFSRFLCRKPTVKTKPAHLADTSPASPFWLLQYTRATEMRTTGPHFHIVTKSGEPLEEWYAFVVKFRSTSRKDSKRLQTCKDLFLNLSEICVTVDLTYCWVNNSSRYDTLENNAVLGSFCTTAKRIPQTLLISFELIVSTESESTNQCSGSYQSVRRKTAGLPISIYNLAFLSPGHIFIRFHHLWISWGICIYGCRRTLLYLVLYMKSSLILGEDQFTLLNSLHNLL
ncbi:membrane-associated guanylate kinase, WW and PDZ domain-containing protein 2, partial [Sigmodon hispidus]